MDPAAFDDLLQKLAPRIEKQHTNTRTPISPHDKLCLTLRFLASGASYKDLMYAFRISDSTISAVIPEVCEALYEELKGEYASPPASPEEWRTISTEFEDKWQFPHCIGAIDGKHINIRAPRNTGSEYFNYKKTFSIVLLGIADANARFVAFDLGSPGSQSDGGVFKHGSLRDLCSPGAIPPSSHLGDRLVEIPYFLIGDEAFALSEHMMKPYPHRSAQGDEKVYNYRLSRAWRIVENAFGIMCARFRILLRTMELDVQNAMHVTRACVILHNYLIAIQEKNYRPSGYMDSEDGSGMLTPGTWRETIEGDVCDVSGDATVRASTVAARDIRDELKDYFYEEVAVDFQWKMTD